ncbi:MAG: GH3 auxin-responsive promoter family protein, partial [Nitrospiria bacterium]
LSASPAVEGHSSGRIPYGSATGVIYEKLPCLMRGSFAIPFLVSQIKDYNLRYYLLARLALGRRISLIGAANPTTLVRIAEAVRAYQDPLIRSIRLGRVCDKPLDLDFGGQEEVISTIGKGLKPNPTRARTLELAAQTRGYLRLGDCWPELRLIACWLGGSIGSQVNKIFDHFDQDISVRDLGYHASEGSFTLPYQDHSPSGILALFNCYYEFIQEDDLESKSPTVLSSHQLALGKQYSILITTLSGLYRYHINDIVEVTGWYRNTPLLKFIRKGRDMANIMGEKVHVNQLILAMSRVEKELGFPITQFRVVPKAAESRYEIHMEFGSDVPPDFLQKKVIPGIDEALSEVNIEYQQKRRSMRLNPPCIVLMHQGWEKEDRRQFVNSGRKDAQYKWQLLAPERTPIDLAFTHLKIESPTIGLQKTKERRWACSTKRKFLK